jgi:membrane associated rhomboid family serine protease
MAYSTRDYARSYLSSRFPPGVKWLLIVNTGIWLLSFMAARLGAASFLGPFELIPAMVVGVGAIWQLFTYMFLHDPNGFFHILFNMLALWMFGSTIEGAWGTRRFLKFYFICGVGAGVCVVIASLLFGDPGRPTIGASGAIFGLLLAFGMLFPDSIVLMSFLFPIKAKYMVMIYGAIALLGSMSVNSGVSSVAHLGGMIFGYMYIKAGKSRKPMANPFGVLQREYQAWKLQRAKKKFQVYLRKQGSDTDRWVH